MPVKRKMEPPNDHRLARANGQIKMVEEGKTRVYRMLPLIDLLRSRDQITPEQHRCGNWFYRDWYNAGLSGSGAIDYSKVRVDMSKVNLSSPRSIDAMTRWKNAVKAIGRIHCRPLTNMVLLEMSPEEYGQVYCGQKSPKLARLAAITVLTASLEALCDHYVG